MNDLISFIPFTMSFPDFPNVIMDIERVELEIACGLQDRVVQTYGGLVHMDFTSAHNVYTDVDKNLLPPMYLLYNTNTGRCECNMIGSGYHYTALHYTALHNTTPHCTTLRCTTLRCQRTESVMSYIALSVVKSSPRSMP
jgi:hypothetical protein